MLYYNFKKMFDIRGIINPYKFLIKHGFSTSKASYIANDHYSSLSLVATEQLCLILNCTPNDLLEWKPEENATYRDDAALNKLIRNDLKNVSQLMEDVPTDKFPELLSAFEEVKKKFLDEKNED